MDQNLAVLQRRIIIVNKEGEELVGLFQETGSRQIVVLSHGLICTKDHRVIAALAKGFEAAGYSTFRFDYSGNGESEGEFGFANYHKEVEDLRSVVEYFVTQENRRTAAIVGHSKGANVVLLYASKYHDIDVVVNVSGRYYMHEGIKERLDLPDYMERIERGEFVGVPHETVALGNVYPVTRESLMERLSINMGEACQLIDPSCRVLTVHGKKDEAVGVKDAEAFKEVMPEHELHIINRASHGYTDSRPLRSLVRKVVSFIQKNVQL